MDKRPVMLNQDDAHRVVLQLFSRLDTWATRSAQSFRDLFTVGKVRVVNPLLHIDDGGSAEFLFRLVRQTIREGRMIDFGFLPNALIKAESRENRRMFEAGEFAQPYDDWVGFHKWEGGSCGYWFGPAPREGARLCIEMYGLDIPGERTFNGSDGAVVFYDMVSYIARPDATDVFPFPMRAYKGIETIPGEERGANSMDPLVTMLRLLHDNSVPVIHHHAPLRLNKRRIERGQPPIPPHTEVQTLGYVTSWRAAGSPRKPHQGGSHASPVAHSRRGHKRRLASGVVVDVRETKVNWRDHAEIQRMFYKVTI